MAGLSWTQSDIDKLKEAIASGAQSVSYRDRTVTYRSLSEMERVLAKMEGSVGNKKKVKRVNPQFDSGL